MADPRDCPALRAGSATSVVEVIDRLTEIRDCTGKVAPECGIAQFSELYLTITQRIWDHIQAGGFFADNEYLARLDVTFANRYFDALRAWAGGRRTPRSLAGALRGAQRRRDHRRPAGRSRRQRPRQLRSGGGDDRHRREMGDADLDTGTRREDYAKVNDVFAERMERCCATSSRRGRPKGKNRNASPLSAGS